MTIGGLLSAAVHQLLRSRMSVLMWAIACAFYVLTGSLVSYLDSVEGMTLASGLIIPWLVAGIWLFWVFTRGLGHAASHEEGSFGAWFGWSCVAILPMLTFLIGFATVDYHAEIGFFADSGPWWATSISLSILLALPVPVLVHSVGRAIDREGPSFSTVWARLKAHYVAIFVAYLVTMLPSLLGDMATEVVGDGSDPVAIYSVNILAWLCYMAQFLVSTALLAAVWRSISRRDTTSSDSVQLV